MGEGKGDGRGGYAPGDDDVRTAGDGVGLAPLGKASGEIVSYDEAGFSFGAVAFFDVPEGVDGVGHSLAPYFAVVQGDPGVCGDGGGQHIEPVRGGGSLGAVFEG